MNIHFNLKKYPDKVIYILGILVLIGILCFLVYTFYFDKKPSASSIQPSLKNSKEIETSLNKIYQQNGATDKFVSEKIKDLRNIFE